MCFEDEIYSHESHFPALQRELSANLDMDLCSYTTREWGEKQNGAAKLVSAIKRSWGK